MIKKSLEGVEWLEFELFQPFENLFAAIFLKHGGVSLSPYDSLNLSSYVGDNPCHVATNHERVKKILNIDRFIYPNCNHGTQVAVADHQNTSFEATDALLTKEADLPLFMTHADCQIALFYDPINEIIGSVHAGWRGQIQGIYQKTVDHMRSLFGTKPEDIFVGISPSLGFKNAEFKNYETEIPSQYWHHKDELDRFNLWNLAEEELLTAGLLSSNIQIARIDTYEEEQFFSYRRSKGITGRNAACIVKRS